MLKRLFSPTIPAQTPQVPDVFRRRFGAVGAALADVLHPLSLDLVALVCKYVVYGVATAGAQPNLLFSFSFASQAALTADPFHRDPFYTCHSIACSRDCSAIYVGDVRGVQIFDSNGELKQRLLIGFCAGIACDDGEVFLSDSKQHQLAVYRQDGGFVHRLGDQGSGKGQFNCPLGLAVEKGQIYVVDSGNHRVQVLRKDGRFVREFGSKGRADGQFIDPRDVALTANTILVNDRAKHCVQVFDKKKASFLCNIGSYDHGTGESPNHLTVDRQGNAVVSGERVQVFGPDGVLITAFALESRDGLFNYPQSVCVDTEGRFLVGDSRCHVRVFAFESRA